MTEKQKVYLVQYGDCECCNLIGVFSTREKAEEYLAPYRELEEQYGKNFMFGFYPSIDEIEIDSNNLMPFEFITTVSRHGDYYHAFTRFRHEYDSIESGDRWFKTFTVDKDTAIEEAKEYFKKLQEQGISTDDSVSEDEDIDEELEW